MSRYSRSDLAELQKSKEVWWPEPGSQWRTASKLVTVICVPVDCQQGEWMICYRDEDGNDWSRTLRSWNNAGYKLVKSALVEQPL